MLEGPAETNSPPRRVTFHHQGALGVGNTESVLVQKTAKPSPRKARLFIKGCFGIRPDVQAGSLSMKNELRSLPLKTQSQIEFLTAIGIKQFIESLDCQQEVPAEGEIPCGKIGRCAASLRPQQQFLRPLASFCGLAARTVKRSSCPE